MPHAVRIAAIWHRIGKPPANSKLALRLPKQQQPSIGGLIAAFKIDCEFLASDRWQVEGKRCSVDHGGCGAAWIHIAIRLNTDLLRESLVLRHSRQPNSHASCIIRASVTGLGLSIPFSTCEHPFAGVVLLYGVGARPPPDGV